MTGLVEWQQPNGTTVTFQDCRTGVKTAPEPEPLILPSSREVAGHEARHVAAALLLGIPVVEARADWPDFLDKDKAHVVGYVEYLPATTWTSADGRIVATGRHRTPRKDAIVRLAGDMSDDRDTKAVGYTGEWPPAWPPTDKLGPDSDEARLAEYVKAAGLDEHDWKALCDEAKRLADMEEFQELAGRIGSLLEFGMVMNEAMLKDAYEMVIRASFKGMHQQIDQLHAEIRQMSRELDEQTEVNPEFERVRQETRDGMYAYLQAVDEAAVGTAPGPLLSPADTKHAPMRTTSGRGTYRTSTFPVTITATR